MIRTTRRPAARFRRPTGDSGATLILALVIITGVAVVAAALLPQAYTALAANLSIRDQSSTAYAADGAAQTAINTLRTGTFDNDNDDQCFDSGNTLALNNFAPAAGGQSTSSATSVAVTCTAEAGTGAQASNVPITSANRPAQAVLTLGSNSLEVSQLYGVFGEKTTIQGGAVSNGSIVTGLGSLVSSGGTITARKLCSGQYSPACTTVSTRTADPNYAAPTVTPAAPSSMPACNDSSKVAVFQPGLYTSAAFLNLCQASWLYFTPGVYYFNFNDLIPTWFIGRTVVGGTLSSGTVTNSAPSTPGACVSPLNSTSAAGVEMVFGGSSNMTMLPLGQAEFCASYSATSPPIAVYGLRSAVGSVPGESGCITTVLLGCSLIYDNLFLENLYVEGLVYAPRANVFMYVNPTRHPYLADGIVSRSLTFSPNLLCLFRTCKPMISIPSLTTGPSYGTANTIVDLSVYVCPGQSSCTTNGSPSLTARVLIHDPSGTPVAGQRVISILSWSTQQ